MEEIPPDHERLIELLLHHSGGDLRGKKILVIGDRHGFLTDYLLEQGADAHGIDMHDGGFHSSKAHIAGRLIRANAKDLSHFKGQQFDFIVSNAVMSPQGLRTGRFKRFNEKVSWGEDYPGSGQELKDLMAQVAFSRDAMPIHQEAYVYLKPGGYAIHTAFKKDSRIAPPADKLRPIGYKIISSGLINEKHELVLRKPF